MLTRREMLEASGKMAAAACLGSRAHIQALLERADPRYHAFRRGFGRKEGARFAFGAAISDQEVRHMPALMRLVAEQCDLITLAGPLYWRTLRPDPREAFSGVRAQEHEPAFDFSEADRCLSFAETHGLGARGHTLVWHKAMPEWVARVLSNGSSREVLERHISSVVDRYRGRISSWDVVNEIVDVESDRRDKLRHTLWLESAGTSYAEMAFQAAHDADAAARLGYNEFGLLDDSPAAESKRAAVLALLRSWLQNGVPIHYLGLQAHLSPVLSFSQKRLGTFLRAVNDMGLDLYITELDVNDRVLPADKAIRDAAVADTYERFLSVAFASVKIPVVVTWGLSDADSWLQREYPRKDGLPQRPLPFDSELAPKPAWSVIDGFRAR